MSEPSDRWSAALDELRELTSGDPQLARSPTQWWLDKHLTLERASVISPLLAWPLDELIDDGGGVATEFFRVGGVMRAPGPRDPVEEAERERREQWRHHRYAWTCRILRDGVLQRADDVLARALIVAERTLMKALEDSDDDASDRMEVLLRHPSMHVRGYGWLGLLWLHESGWPLTVDVEAHAHREPVEGMPLAAWVCSQLRPEVALIHLLSPALADPSERTRREALRVIERVPRSPLLGLAETVAALGRQDMAALRAWCRLAPEDWAEVLPMAGEREPAKWPIRLRRRAEERGQVLATHVPSMRATLAMWALAAASDLLPDEAVAAITALAGDRSYHGLLRAFGPRARAALPLLAACAAADPERSLSTLIEIGGATAIEFIEPLIERQPSRATALVPLGEDAVPILRRALARPLALEDRRWVVDGIERLGSPSLAPEAWALLEDSEEDLVSFAIAALVRMDSVTTPLEQHRVMDAFLRFQPTRWAFAPAFSRVATALASVLPRWIEQVTEELLLVKLVRAAGFLREWGRPLLPALRAIERPFLRDELVRSIGRIEAPPPMFEPNR